MALASNSSRANIETKISYHQGFDFMKKMLLQCCIISDRLVFCLMEYDIFSSVFCVGWKECFSVIIGSDEVSKGKPSPDMYDPFSRHFSAISQF